MLAKLLYPNHQNFEDKSLCSIREHIKIDWYCYDKFISHEDIIKKSKITDSIEKYIKEKISKI